MSVMPMPESSTDTMTAQVLVELGKLQTAVAVMDERLKMVPDHEQRIRRSETAIAELAGGRDTWARVLGGVGGLGAIAAIVAVFVHH